MIRDRLHAGWASAATLSLLLAASAASATPATFSQVLHFTTGSPTPSLWGPGQTSSSFGADGSAGIPQVTGPFDVQITPGLGVAYDFSASSGSVAANVSGTLQASYDDRLSAPGTSSIATAFSITGIPEPGTVFLLGSGLHGLAVRGRASGAGPATPRVR